MKKTTFILILSCLFVIFIIHGGNAIGSGQSEESASVNDQNNEKKPYDLSTILVKFKPGVTKKQKNDVASLAGGKFKDKNDDGIDDRYQHILAGRLVTLELQGEKGRDLASLALRILENHPLLEYAEYNYLRSIDYTYLPNDERFDELWGLHNTGQTAGSNDADIDAPEAWEISSGSSEVIVGVIDTGIDYNHEDLANNMWINPGEIPGNGVDDDGNGYVDDIHGINAIIDEPDDPMRGDPMDDHYHGTHCAGIIGAIGDNGKGVTGVNWTVKLIGIKFASAGGGSDSDAIESINYAVGLRNRGVNIRVLSNSWGGADYSLSLFDAITAANNAGILFVAAAGNYSSDNDARPFYPASYDIPNVLAVAATDHDDNLCSFSNYGATTVDIAAPGSAILSTYPNNIYYATSGTSMATPHVAGAAALLLSVNDELTVEDLKNYLMNYGDLLPSLNGKCLSGSRLNVNDALSQVPPSEPTFRLSAEIEDQSVVQGQTASYNLDIQSFQGFSGQVDLSVSFNPEIAGTVYFDSNPGQPGFSSTLNIETTSATDLTDYIITITGVSGSITKKTTMHLEVIPENFTTVIYDNNEILPIPDYNLAGVEGVIDIPQSLEVWKVECNVNITHTFIGDLIVKLISPTGTEVILHNREGGSADDLHTTYHPVEFKGEDTAGPWTLAVSDVVYADEGTLDGWTLTIHGIPPGSVNQPPTIGISAPDDGSTFSQGDQINFAGSADDPESSDISSSIEWTSSIDGFLDMGASVSRSDLSVGTHTITAKVTDPTDPEVIVSDSITITVNKVNSPPLTVDDSYSIAEDTVLNVSAPGVLGNDSDADGDSLSAVLDTNVSNGTLTLNMDGSLTYTPSAGFSGTDSFSYKASDNNAESDPAVVTITVSAANSPPTAEFSFLATGRSKAEFTDQSSDDGTIVSWSWEFGDGKSNSAQNPKHKYREPGKYIATLTVIDDGGASDSVSKEIEVIK
jgi:serine protease